MPIELKPWPMHEHDEADGHREQRRDADPPQMSAMRGLEEAASATVCSYLSVRAITRRWISFVPS